MACQFVQSGYGLPDTALISAVFFTLYIRKCQNCPALLQPSSGHLVEIFTEKAEKVRKIGKKLIFFDFFVVLACKYTNLVCCNSVDRNNGTHNQPNQPKEKDNEKRKQHATRNIHH